MAVSTRWDLPALRSGGSVALVFAVPFAVLARILSDGEKQSAWSAPLFLASLSGFFLGAGVAAWHQRCRTPLSHGIVAAAGTYAIAQLLVVAINLLLGRDVRWFAIVLTFTMVSAVGLLGGLVGLAMQRRGVEPRP